MEIYINSTIELKRENIQHDWNYRNIDKDKVEIIYRDDDGGIIVVAEALAIESLNGYQKKDDMVKVKITRIIDEELLKNIL